MKANVIHSYYQDKIGSQQIASRKALRKIEKIAKRFDRNYPNGHVLEIGTGIGTICDLITSTTNLKYIGFEKNEFCIEQLKSNVASTNYMIKKNFTDFLLEVKDKESLLIIDDFISKSNLELLLNTIKPIFIIVEGHRFSTRRDVVSIISSSYRKFSFTIRLYIFSPDSKKGAFLMIIHNTNLPIFKPATKLITKVSIQRFKFVNYHVIYRILRFLRIYSFNSYRRINKLLVMKQLLIKKLEFLK